MLDLKIVEKAVFGFLLCQNDLTDPQDKEIPFHFSSKLPPRDKEPLKIFQVSCTANVKQLVKDRKAQKTLAKWVL